jgi:hypothetical protein
MYGKKQQLSIHICIWSPLHTSILPLDRLNLRRFDTPQILRTSDSVRGEHWSSF